MARILLIDDEPDVLDGLKRVLEGAAHQVVTATGGEVALATLSAQPVDLIVTDINMPGMDGIELVNAVRKRVPPIPVIAMSGGGIFGQRFLLDSAQGLGATATLDKPFDLDDFLRAVDDALSG